MAKQAPGTAMAARLAALLVLLAVAAAIAWVHRHDIIPPEPVAAADDPAAPCIAERHAGIDKMLADGEVDEARAKLFKIRAEALCRAQAGQDSSPPQQ